ncbi:hypothetical protein SHKM778_48030 [Streptomyces sp. KM77-8]|uniref:Transposase n=1 Tax=Streptomyces haneummycinicus TaxID=3074435 RepID=A0AAT9HLW2_9ACTN
MRAGRRGSRWSPPPVCSAWVEKLAESLRVTQLSKSQLSAMTEHLAEQGFAWHNRPLEQGPYAFIWGDALTQLTSVTSP